MIIVGCGRSGTSILGELFEHIPGYDYMFEPQFSELKNAKPAKGKALAVKVPKGDEDKRTPGLAFNIDEILSLIPNNKFIFIVRHPLDAICSLKPGISENWSHNPKPPKHEELQANLPIEEQCAHHWNYINSVGYTELAKRVENVLIVRYEDLVAKPHKTAEKILEHIGVHPHEISKELEDYTSKVQNKTKKSYHAKHQSHWYRDDHKKRVAHWKKDLSKDEAKRAWNIVGDTAMEFGYSF